MATGLVDRPVATDAPPGQASTGGLRALLARLRRRVFGPTDPAEVERERVLELEQARAVLEQARGVVARGWVQDAFYLVRDGHGRLRPVSPLGLLLLSRTDVAGACLVGAVAHASAGAGARERRGPATLAVDTLWEALAERAGWPGGRRTGDVPHPSARAARVRDLAQWNDEPARTRAEVLDLIDRAVSRTIHSAVR